MPEEDRATRMAGRVVNLEARYPLAIFEHPIDGHPRGGEVLDRGEHPRERISRATHQPRWFQATRENIGVGSVGEDRHAKCRAQVCGIARVVRVAVGEEDAREVSRREGQRAQASEERDAFEAVPGIDDEAIAGASVEHEYIRDDEAAQSRERANHAVGSQGAIRSRSVGRPLVWLGEKDVTRGARATRNADLRRNKSAKAAEATASTARARCLPQGASDRLCSEPFAPS